jgi:hypothetical protein
MLVQFNHERLSIYTLTDPRNGVVMYVGCTERPKGRESQHRGANRSTLIGRWMEELAAAGVEPVFTIIEKAIGWDSGRTKENRLIAKYKAIGQCSLNQHVGRKGRFHKMQGVAS